jgi:hypothetical protein
VSLFDPLPGMCEAESDAINAYARRIAAEAPPLPPDVKARLRLILAADVDEVAP